MNNSPDWQLPIIDRSIYLAEPMLSLRADISENPLAMKLPMQSERKKRSSIMKILERIDSAEEEKYEY